MSSLTGLTAIVTSGKRDNNKIIDLSDSSVLTLPKLIFKGSEAESVRCISRCINPLIMVQMIIALTRSKINLETIVDMICSKGGMVRLQRGVTVWLTGLSGAGKTTIGQFLEQELRLLGYKVELLDGDLVRQNLSKGLGFSKEDRDENIRRIGFVAHLLTRNDVIVLVTAISPYAAIRSEVKERIGDFIEVYVNAPLEVCEQRDVKGLYKKARDGKIKYFTGIDDSYEVPLHPEVECKTEQESITTSATKVLKKLEELHYINPIFLPQV